MLIEGESNKRNRKSKIKNRQSPPKADAPPAQKILEYSIIQENYGSLHRRQLQTVSPGKTEAVSQGDKMLHGKMPARKAEFPARTAWSEPAPEDL
jgi:hypothetical protein